MELRLHSPVGAGRDLDLVYSWPTEDTKEVNYTEEDLADEIRETFSAVLVDHPNLRLPFRIPPISALCKYESLKELCEKWNDSVDSYAYEKTFENTKASLPQAQHIISQVYNRTVIYPERLNQYSAFSPNVYGETSPKMVSHMIRQLCITENDTFLDLGSGVGQVVLQMAAAANFKRCVGIETCETPCEYAVGLQNEFQKIMKWYGKTYTEFRLYNGDFLDKKFRDTILKSSIIFANNYAFGPEVDHYLKEIFADLDDGVRIVSSKQFSPLHFRINQRNLSDIGTIMNVSTMTPFEGAVSWTHSKVSFYVQVIDRSKLERYFEEYAKNQQNGVPAERPKRRSVKPSDYSERKENEEELEDKPKKRSSRPRYRYTLPQKKRPRRSDSSANRSSNEDAILGVADVPGEPNFSEVEQPPPTMPDLEVQQLSPKVPQLSSKMPEPVFSEDQQLPPEMPVLKPKTKSPVPQLTPKMPERDCSEDHVLPPKMPALKPKAKSSAKVEAQTDKSKNRSKPPKKRMSEVDILLASNWDFSGSSSQKNKNAGNSRASPNTSSQPAKDPYGDAPWRNVQITTGPPKCVDELLARMRVQYFDMIELMKNRAYVQKILEEIRVEQERNKQLLTTKAYLEKVVNDWLKEGKQLLMGKLAELGYDEENWQYVFAELQDLGRNQVGLSLQAATLKRDIDVLEENIMSMQKRGLVSNINEQVQKKRFLQKAVTELTGQLHRHQGQTPPRTVFPDSPPSEGELNEDELMHSARLYVNDVRVYDSLVAPDIPRKSVVSVAAANADVIPVQYKISPSSVIPKKRR